MHFIEKDGKRYAVLDHLVSSKTGKPVEILMASPQMEASMLLAGQIGRSTIQSVLDLTSPNSTFKVPLVHGHNARV